MKQDPPDYVNHTINHEETATDAESQVTQALQQASKPVPHKKSILDHLTTAKALIEDATAASGLVSALVSAIEAVHKVGAATLLSDLQRLIDAHRDTPHRINDVVHTDFQHSNILVHDHQITGVVDWDAVHAGDCVFDIATLLFYSYDERQVREQLWRYALERASLRLLSIYLAHLILRQVDWSLRHHDQRTIDRYLNRGNTLLVEISDRFKHSR